MQKTVDDLSALADHLRLSVDEINVELNTKASTDLVHPRLDNLETLTQRHANALAGKADASQTSDQVIYISFSLYIYIYIYMYVCVCLCVYMCIYVYLHRYVYMYIYVCVCVYIYQVNPGDHH